MDIEYTLLDYINELEAENELLREALHEVLDKHELLREALHEILDEHDSWHIHETATKALNSRLMQTHTKL